MSQLTAKDISQRLALRAEDVARYLLGPDGKREGQELRYGDVGGSAGKSLGVHLRGDKAGVWCDFSSGESGDLLDLWRTARGISLRDAIGEAKKYLGLDDVPLQVSRKRIATVTPINRGGDVIALQPDGLQFLTGDRRVSEQAVAAYKLAQSRGREIVFPYLSPGGELLQTKYRKFPDDAIRTAAGGAKCLFGWPAIPRDARTVVICEGEYKALLWWDYGHPALSVPFGAGKGKQDWIEVEYDNLAQFDTIYLAMDADEQGETSTTEITERLGADRVAVISLPLPPGGKDIQSCRRADVPAAVVNAAVAKAQPRGPAELRGASDYTDEVVSMFETTGPEPGLRMPWRKVGDRLVLRDGELSIWAGRTGHGKSQVVGFVLCHALANNYRLCVASFEFKVKGWMARMLRQLSAMHQPSAGYVRVLMDWLGDSRLWAFDAQGTAEYRRMLDVFRYCRRRHGTSMFLVDNLTGLGIGEDDLQGQKEVIQALSNFARDENVHVMLVHHVRKVQHQNSHDQMPDQGEIKGSGTILDLASTVMTVWRNKRKEKKVKEMGPGAEIPPDLVDDPDVIVACSKQRNYYGLEDGEPSIGLWWDPSAFHYLARSTHTPRAFITLDMPKPAEVHNLHPWHEAAASSGDF